MAAPLLECWNGFEDLESSGQEVSRRYYEKLHHCKGNGEEVAPLFVRMENKERSRSFLRDLRIIPFVDPIIEPGSIAAERKPGIEIKGM